MIGHSFFVWAIRIKGAENKFMALISKYKKKSQNFFLHFTVLFWYTN